MEYANTQTHFDGNMYIVVSSIEDFVLFPFYNWYIITHRGFANNTFSTLKKIGL